MGNIEGDAEDIYRTVNVITRKEKSKTHAGIGTGTEMCMLQVEGMKGAKLYQILHF